jgi:hypothetical protein
MGQVLLLFLIQEIINVVQDIEEEEDMKVLKQLKFVE